MKNLYKNLIAIVMSIVGIFFVASCGNENSKKSIVCTIYPIYDWVNNIIGDSEDWEVKLLLDNGVDLHSFQASVDDIVMISTADLFIYVGGESDEWCEDAIENSTNENQHTISLIEALGDLAKEEEIVEGMEGEDEEHEHEHEHEHDHEHEDEEEIEYDEHVWLSLKNAAVLSKEIEKEIADIDSDNKDTYETNLNSYLNKLTELDNKYQNAVDAAKTKTILFGDRFPFRYLVDDYEIDYYAAFVGCSAETEASFETIKFLANKVDELDLKVIFIIESSNGEIANTIKSSSAKKNQEIVVIDSIQSVTSTDVKNGTSYLSKMENNLTALKKGLA